MKHIPILLVTSGSTFVSYEHTKDCRSHQRGWFGRPKRCDCGKPESYAATTEYDVRQAARLVFSGGEPS